MSFHDRSASSLKPGRERHASELACLRSSTTHSIPNEKVRVVSLSILLIVYILVLSLYAPMLLVQGASDIFPICDLSMAVLLLADLLACLIVLIFPSKFLHTTLTVEVLFNYSSVIIFCGCLLLYYVGERITVVGGQNIVVLIVPILAVVFSRRWAVIITWMVLAGLSSLSTVIYEFARPEFVAKTLQQQYCDEPFLGQVSNFTVIFLPFALALVTYLLVIRNRDKEHELTLETASAIALLDFSNDAISTLNRKTIEQCSETELALKQTVTNLEKYAQYLPEHLKTGNAIRRSHSETGTRSRHQDTASAHLPSSLPVDGEGGSTSGSGSHTSATSRTSTTASTLFTDAEIRTSVRSRTMSAKKRFENEAARMRGLRTTVGTVMLVDIRGFKDRIFQSRDPHIVRRSVENFDAISDCLTELARGFSGTVETIDGDRIMLLWNGSVACFAHERNAVSCADQFLRKLYQIQPHKLELLDVLIFISSGPLMFGPIGHVGIKRVVTIGRPCSLVFGMKRGIRLIPPLKPGLERSSSSSSGSFSKGETNANMPTQSFLFVDESAHGAVKFKYRTKLVSVVRCDGVLSRLYRIEAAPHKGAADGVQSEWMYEISDHLVETDSTSGEVGVGEVAELSREWDQFWDLCIDSSPPVERFSVLENLARFVQRCSELSVIHRSFRQDASQLFDALTCEAGDGALIVEV